MTPEEREKDHIASYCDNGKRDMWGDDAKIKLFGKKYKLVIFVVNGVLEEHRVMMGQFCINDWLSDEEEFEVVRYLNEYWPEIQKP